MKLVESPSNDTMLNHMRRKVGLLPTYTNTKSTQVRLVDRDTERWNIEYQGHGWRNFFVFFVDCKLYVLFLTFISYYIGLHFTFAALYYACGYTSFINLENFMDFFYFSVQTMETIGYGYFAPVSDKANVLVVIQVFIGVLTSSFILSIFVARFTRPSALKKHIIWSEVALVNKIEMRYVGVNIDQLADGAYLPGKEKPVSKALEEKTKQMIKEFGGSAEEDATCPVLTIRLGNPHHTQFIDPCIKMYLIRRKDISRGETRFKPMLPDSDVFNDFADDFIIEEMTFELYRQVGRVRGLTLSTPVLGLPWTIAHPIDKYSPLYGYDTPEALEKMQAEIVCTFSGTSEALGVQTQSRWSFIASEIIWNAKFVPITYISSKTKKFIVDFTKISNYFLLDAPGDKEHETFGKEATPQQNKVRIYTDESLQRQAETPPLSESDTP